MHNQIIVDPSIKLEHIGNIFEIISRVPEFAEKNAQVSAIEVLPGGLTNFNFKVTIDNENYALRVAGPGTNEYLDRPAEKYNAQIMSDIGINAPIIYYDEVYGHQICKYIEGKTMHIPDFKDSYEYLSKAAKVFRKYHTCGRSFKADFDPLKETYAYLKILKENNAELYEGSEQMLEYVERIKEAFKKHPQELAPCHNDPLCENWLADEEDNLWLIDWEYAGNNQPMFDLGALAIEADLNSEKAKEKLDRLGYTNIRYKIGDGSEGWSENAPYDRIIVTAAAERIPDELISQLKPGGKLIIPVGPKGRQELQLITKDLQDKIHIASLGKVIFVEMKGKYGWTKNVD